MSGVGQQRCVLEHSVSRVSEQICSGATEHPGSAAIEQGLAFERVLVPCQASCLCHKCGGVLCRVRTYQSQCYTLAMGRREGLVIFLQCASCQIVCGGPSVGFHNHTYIFVYLAYFNGFPFFLCIGDFSGDGEGVATVSS